jgi:hypothetical protein
MISSIRGNFYDTVILQIMVPEDADVSSENYEAKQLDKQGNVSAKAEDLKPFVICHPVALRAKVVTWLGREITWTFDPAYPVLLRKIFASPAPVVVENGVPTTTVVTSIQVGY